MARVRDAFGGRATTVRHRTVPVWLVLVVAVGLLAASGAAAIADRHLVAPPGPVLLVGDSLFFQSTNELERTLRGDGWTVRTTAVPGAGIAGGGYLDGFTWPPELRRQVEQHQPTVAVVELGTNGCGHGCGSVPDAIDRVLDSLEGVDLVLWLTVRGGTDRPRDPQEINAHLEDAAQTVVHLDLLRYDRWFTGRSELIRPDGVHLTPAGQRALAHRVRAALRERAGIG
jgi:lysophospholipase L1-like esterase